MIKKDKGQMGGSIMKKYVGRFLRRGGHLLATQMEDAGRAVSIKRVATVLVVGMLLSLSLSANALAQVGPSTGGGGTGGNYYYNYADYVTVWKFDNPTSLGYDSFGYNHAKAYGNPVSWTLGGPLGTSLFFNKNRYINLDGIDDYLEVPHNDSLNASDNSTIKISFWVRTKMPTGSQSKIQTIIDKRQSNPYRGYHVFVNNGHLGVQLADGGAGNGYTNYYADSLYAPSWFNYSKIPQRGWIADGQWHFVEIIIVRSEFKVLKFCVDGFENSLRSTSDRKGSLNNTMPFRIGLNSFGEYRFAGDLDDLMVSIWKN